MRAHAQIRAVWTRAREAIGRQYLKQSTVLYVMSKVSLLGYLEGETFIGIAEKRRKIA